MGRGIFALTVRLKNENWKHHHLTERANVEGPRIHAAWRGVAHQQVGSGKLTENHQDARQAKDEPPEPTVNVDTMSRNQSRLDHQQKDPTGKCRRVNVNGDTGEMGTEKASEEVRGAKSDQNADQNEDCGCGKEDMVEPPARQQPLKTRSSNSSRCIVHTPILFQMCVVTRIVAFCEGAPGDANLDECEHWKND